MGEEMAGRAGALPNLALRRFMDQAGVSEERLAGLIAMDARTVRRWLDGETVPQARSARVTADALGCELQDLWPDVFPVLDPPSAGTVAVSTYASRAQVPSRSGASTSAPPRHR